MFEITTRIFVLEEGDDLADMSHIISTMPGYRGHMQISGYTITAEFYTRVI